MIFCLCTCAALILYSCIVQIYDILVVTLIGTPVSILCDLCTGTCMLPWMATTFGHDHLVWLNDNLFNHPEFATISMDETLQQGMQTLASKIREEAPTCRAEFCLESYDHDDDDGVYHVLSFKLKMAFKRKVGAVDEAIQLAPTAPLTV